MNEIFDRHTPRYYEGESAYAALRHRFGREPADTVPQAAIPDLPEPRELSCAGMRTRLYLPSDETDHASRATPCVFMLRDGFVDAENLKQIRAYLDVGLAAVSLTAGPQRQRDWEAHPERCVELARGIAAFAEYTAIFDDALDPAALAVDGWITAWIATRSQVFRAGVQRSALINPATAYGTCPAGGILASAYDRPNLKQKMEALAGTSVLADIDACKTPLLIDCDMEETFYSREQCEQLYSAMKDRNPDVPCKMLVHGQSHAQNRDITGMIAAWCREQLTAAKEAEKP